MSNAWRALSEFDLVGFYGSLNEARDLRALQESLGGSGRLFDRTAAFFAWLGVGYGHWYESRAEC
jgi:hypothetical protein